MTRSVLRPAAVGGCERVDAMSPAEGVAEEEEEGLEVVFGWLEALEKKGMRQPQPLELLASFVAADEFLV